MRGFLLQEKERLKEMRGGAESKMKCRRGTLLSFLHFQGLIEPPPDKGSDSLSSLR